MTKKCCSCQKNKLSSEFGKNKWRKDGLQHNCKKLEIDHVIPRSAFNYTSPEDIDFAKCWGLKNLQLLTKKENRKKWNRLDAPFQPSLAFGGTL